MTEAELTALSDAIKREIERQAEAAPQAIFLETVGAGRLLVDGVLDLRKLAFAASTAALSDAELLALHRGMEADDPMLDLVCGELERRGLDL